MEFQHPPIHWFRSYAHNLPVNAHAEDRRRVSPREFGFKVPILARKASQVSKTQESNKHPITIPTRGQRCLLATSYRTSVGGQPCR